MSDKAQCLDNEHLLHQNINTIKPNTQDRLTHRMPLYFLNNYQDVLCLATWHCVMLLYMNCTHTYE